jgi:hypothetical protein
MTEPKALKDMTWEEAEPIYRALHEGKPVEIYYMYLNEWGDVPLGTDHEPARLYANEVYRIKQTKPSINWDHVKSRCICLARDESGRVYLYSEIPEQGATSWIQGTPECGVEGFASYDPGTCDWKDSLVIRPGHEVNE